LKALPHKLALYRAAVQHPPAEISFLHRAYRHYRERDPLLLKEDFAGTAAVAAAWVGVDEDHQALAVDSHAPTLRWAQRAAMREIGQRVTDLHFLHADVMTVVSPKVDVVLALNFSTFIYHDRASLRDYFRHARRSLRPGGMLVIDAYGGPGAMRVGEQRRPAMTEAGAQFEYRWEQRGYDAVTARVDCRIHFAVDSRVIRGAFRYDWRLWTLPELTELMREAGFRSAEVWCDRYSVKKGTSDGKYRPLDYLIEREDWVAYVIGS
jgi:SAM-dependent methyltransferase